MVAIAPQHVYMDTRMLLDNATRADLPCNEEVPLLSIILQVSFICYLYLVTNCVFFLFVSTSTNS
jgi:hypothetical protein